MPSSPSGSSTWLPFSFSLSLIPSSRFRSERLDFAVVPSLHTQLATYPGIEIIFPRPVFWCHLGHRSSIRPHISSTSLVPRFWVCSFFLVQVPVQVQSSPGFSPATSQPARTWKTDERAPSSSPGQWNEWFLSSWNTRNKAKSQPATEHTYLS